MAYFDYRGIKIFYKVVERQEKQKSETKQIPLLMLNGIMMSTESWAMFKHSLSKNRDLIFVDFVDQGKSDAYGSPYDHGLQVDLVIALLNHLKIEKVHIFGISYGGLIALQVALAKPALVEKLMLFNTSAYTTPWLRDIGNGWNAAACSENPEDYYHVAIPYIYSHIFYNGSYDWMQGRKSDLMKIFTREFRDRMIRLTASSENYDIRDRLHEINHPTMIVCSEYDYLTPKSESYFLKEKIKGAILFELKDTGHASMYERPDEFLILIEGFLGYQR